MTTKLFTIGDSVSQGFMSGAAAKGAQCYSTRVAEVLGATPYHFPTWPAGGLPANIEDVMRKLKQEFGNDISGGEWVTVLLFINGVLDESEDYYERGKGRPDIPYHDNGIDYFHNVASWGMDVVDAWDLTPAMCAEVIGTRRRRWYDDGFLSVADNPFFRTALKVLDPRLTGGGSPLQLLQQRAETEGVENVIVWLGANNALETIFDLEIRETNDRPEEPLHEMSHMERAAFKYNLWKPADFIREYDILFEKIKEALANNKHDDWNVFIGTVPQVTIAPLAKGVGDKTEFGDPNDADYKGWYYEYYTYFMFDKDDVEDGAPKLTMDKAIHIDDYIAAYNTHIREKVKAEPRFHLVDLALTLSQLAWKRNNGNPTYHFPDHFPDISPPVNTEYYHVTRAGKRIRGGLFSLDGVHPSGIGQGIIAHEILKAMRIANIDGANENALDWPVIFNEDSLHTAPIDLMEEVYENHRLNRILLKLFQLKTR